MEIVPRFLCDMRRGPAAHARSQEKADKADATVIELGRFVGKSVAAVFKIWTANIRDA